MTGKSQKHPIFNVVNKIRIGKGLSESDLEALVKFKNDKNVSVLIDKVCADYMKTLDAGISLKRYQVMFLVSLGKIDDPRKRAKSAAERMEDMSNRNAEIGADLHAVKDPARKEACRLDLVRFVMEYCIGDFDGALFDHEPSAGIIEYLRELERSILGTASGGTVLVVMPRGIGKTTCAQAAAIWAAAYGHRKFIVMIAANADNAEDIMKDVWGFLEGDGPFFDDFPEIAVPIKKLEGKIQRCASQTINGKRTEMKCVGDEIVFPTVEGSPASGVTFIARGIHGAIRGLKRGKQRPDYLLIDDPQTRETAHSEAQTSMLEKKIDGDLIGLAGHKRKIAGVMSSTPIEAYDLCDRYMDASAHPSWRRVTYPLVKQWPKATELWDEYLELRRIDTLTDSKAFEGSRQFYKENRAAMDEGADVLDPLAFDEELEDSAIQHAYNALFEMGKASFMAEYQLEPEKPDSALELTAKNVAAAISNTPRMELPEGFHAATAYIDCMNKAGLRWMILGIGSNRRAVILGYGRYPENAPIYPPKATKTQMESAFTARLSELVRQIADKPIKVQGGYTRVGVIGVDGNWQTKLVNRVHKVSPARGLMTVVRGTATEKFVPAKPDGEWKAGVASVGDNCYEFLDKFARRCIRSHSNYWKEYAQRSFLQPPLLSGSVCFAGDSPTEHYDCAVEIVSQQLAFRGVDKNGKEFWRWKIRSVGAADHYLDCLAQCLMLASFKRYFNAKQEGGMKNKAAASGADASASAGANPAALQAAPQKKTAKRKPRVRIIG